MKKRDIDQIITNVLTGVGPVEEHQVPNRWLEETDRNFKKFEHLKLFLEGKIS